MQLIRGGIAESDGKRTQTGKKARFFQGKKKTAKQCAKSKKFDKMRRLAKDMFCPSDADPLNPKNLQKFFREDLAQIARFFSVLRRKKEDRSNGCKKKKEQDRLFFSYFHRNPRQS